jgi:hypothetical protein
MFSRSRNSLLLWNLEICYHVHKSLLLNPLLSHLNTAYALSARLSRIHVNTGLTQLALIVVVVCHVGDLGCFLYMNSNWCIQVKSTQEWSAVVSCAWYFILLFPVMFHMVRTLHEFYFVLNWTPDNCWPVESDRSSDRDFFWQELYIFTTRLVQWWRNHAHTQKVIIILLSG